MADGVLLDDAVAVPVDVSSAVVGLALAVLVVVSVAVALAVATEAVGLAVALGTVESVPVAVAVGLAVSASSGAWYSVRPAGTRFVPAASTLFALCAGVPDPFIVLDSETSARLRASPAGAAPVWLRVAAGSVTLGHGKVKPARAVAAAGPLPVRASASAAQLVLGRAAWLPSDSVCLAACVPCCRLDGAD